MTFKVGNGHQHHPNLNRGNGPGRSNSHNHRSDVSEPTGNRSHSHDNTPTRQRELETHGNNLRSRVEGNSHGNGHHRSHDSHHSGRSNSSRSEGGIGLHLSGEVLGLETDARVGLNNSRDGGRSFNFRAGNDGPDFRTDFRNGHEGFQSNRSNDGPGRSNDGPGRWNDGPSANNLLRETISTLRSELSALRPDSRGRSDHPHFRHDSDGFQFNPSNDGRGRSNDGPGNANNLLRETIRTLRSELNSLRSDSNGGSERRTLGFNEGHIERVLHIATRGLEDRLGRGDQPERIARQIMADVSGVVRFDEHFSRLERVGGEPVRRAYEAVLNFALNIPERESNRLPLIVELLRDLNTGAFLHPRDMEGPFPLTGRARIVSEMMALMRTLEAIEKFAAQTRAEPYVKFNGNLPAFSLGRIPGVISGDVVELLAQTLANSGPTLPGMAGRLEIPRLVAALNGVLTDAAGRPLIMADGAPLKLGEMLWFNARPDMIVDLWSVDRMSTRFFPTLLHGFDAVYSLIGFDGRSLSLPRFIAIQSQINASEFEWFFGQAPLSEGWLRSVIEFLKDSISFDHNVLGEMLEEAITNGRFHFAVMRGTVEDGRAVDGSFSFAPALVN